VPDPSIVNVPPDAHAVPAAPTPPMSPVDHPLGSVDGSQDSGGGGGGGALPPETVTLSSVAVASTLSLWLVTGMPT
jgi:hypothetical protein